MLRTMRSLFSKRREVMPHSMVLLMSQPFALTKENYAEAGARAFGMPYDGTSAMHFVEQSPDAFFLKTGDYLVSSCPHWGAYLAKINEEDVETGAALVPEEQRPWWRRQRAWVSFDLMNDDVPERAAMRILAKLLLEVVDERCCGVWLPHKGRFLPNDGTTITELTILSSG